MHSKANRHSGGQQHSVTGHDVARLAGVSQPTVSRALRNERTVSPATRDRVRRAAIDLGYVTLDSGRSLSTRRTSRLGIVCGDLSNPFYPELIEPLRREVVQHGYFAVLLPEDTDPHDAVLVDGTLDGIIILASSFDDPLPAHLKKRGVPFVLTNRTIDADVDWCAMDNERAGRIAVRHLDELGLRRVAMVNGPLTTSTAAGRRAGVLSELDQIGMTLSDEHDLAGPFAYSTGSSAIDSLFDGREPPQAIICGNDVIALGVIHRLRGRGISGVGVVGFDDISMSAWPGHDLTSVGCDLSELANAAMSTFIRRRDTPMASSQQRLLEPTLVVRRTRVGSGIMAG